MHTVVIDAYPNTVTVEQGTTLVLVCRVVGVPSTTVLSYEWTCPNGSCNAQGIDPEWAARIQLDNILVVNMRNSNDTGDYTCTVVGSNTQLASQTHSVTVTSELCIVPWAMTRECSKYRIRRSIEDEAYLLLLKMDNWKQLESVESELCTVPWSWHEQLQSITCQMRMKNKM